MTKFLGGLIVVSVLAFAGWLWAQDDRVAFPQGYEKEFTRYHTFNKLRKGKPSLKELWINATGAGVKEGQPLPHGTVIVMTTYSVKSENDSPAKDDNGLYVPKKLRRIDVMRKEKGYGELYGDKRSGEWEYATFEPDGKLKKGNATRCAACHLEKAAKTDFVFTTEKIAMKK